MSPETLLPGIENPKATIRKADYTTTTTKSSKMANSNAAHRQAMGPTGQQGGNTAGAVTSTAATAAAGDVAITSTLNANKSKTMRTTMETTTTTATKEMSSRRTSLSNAAAAANVITTSQCDSSSGSSTTSSSSSSNGSDVSSINVKSESCGDPEIKIELEASENGAATSKVVGPNDANDLQLAAMKHRPILLSSMNAHIICGLCFGYLIEATTIVECLHSFCHSCLIKHLRTEQYCPRCEMMINTAKPNIKPDTTLQAIVYKLVPGLYERELMRKRAFYKDRPEDAALATPEQRGDDTEHLIFSPSDYMSISLEYADIDDLMKSNTEYTELLKPRYLQCPAMCTVAHLKKLVFGKFEINSHRFTIDIMYKVKTIILLDHYTLMDVAYIYTWKRDAPMRFYFRVKQSLRPTIRVKKALAPPLPKKEDLDPTEISPAPLQPQAMCIVHEPTPSLVVTAEDNKILEPEEIKQEDEAEVSSTTEIPAATKPETPAASKPTPAPAPIPTPLPPPPMEKPKQFEIVQPQSPSISSHESSPTDKLKITIVNKAAKDKSHSNDMKPSAPPKPSKEKKESHKNSSPSSSSSLPKDERKVENIKLKIDLSKQNSVTIINMSDPQRKEIVKPVKPEKEWKVSKTKKEKDGTAKASPKSSNHGERKNKTPSPLTVPPITIKAERISPLAKQSSSASNSSSSLVPKESAEEYKKSQFLKSFALAPINELKLDKPEQSRLLSSEVTLSVVPRNPMKEPTTSSSSKRKSKEPIKAVIKKPRLSPPLAKDDFKIKLPPITTNSSTKTASSSVSSNVSSTSATSSSKKNLMPPPPPLTAMKPPASVMKKAGKLQQAKAAAAPPGSLTPHPMHGRILFAPPGSRTPIAKRYQPILPKASRPNPFANIPSDVNKILKDAGTEIKSIPNEPTPSKVYGPKADNSTLMGPPSMAAPTSKAGGSNTTSRNNTGGSSSKSLAAQKNNSYLNLALYNASKSKGNEAPPGCRTPMYTPNSPIYSPSSPQYVPNYNIPTVPTYKYTPKPSNSNNSYLQSVLNSNSQMSSLFPSPPTKKESNNSSGNGCNSMSNNRAEVQASKRVYPFARSPSPVEDPPEKQLKVKSLLNSCNINIPSSLSITITREDGDSTTNGGQYPKHKSPVNNYIEILKLPEQTCDVTSENKRSSPPMASSLFPNPPVKRVATPPLNANKVINNNNSSSPINMQKPLTMNGSQLGHSSPKTAQGNNSGQTGNLPMMNKAGSNAPNKAGAQSNNKSPLPSNNSKSPPMPLGSEKKTPSPEKRLSSGSAEQKSPKSPDGSASKKFRHILPRQMANQQQPEGGKLQKPSANGNVIGTYAAPNGVSIKIHSGKKVQPSKKSPGTQQKASGNPQQTAVGGSGGVKNPLQSPTMQSQPPPANNKSANAKLSGAAKSSNKANSAAHKLGNANGPGSGSMANMPSLSAAPVSSALPHPMQAMLPPHLAAAAAACQNAAGQAELSKMLKENLLRAQVQAAVANQSNMFYPYAANAAAAAQLGMVNPTMYNYQQAYIMDQLSRMQRAGNDAFTEYLQKLKNSMELQKIQSEATGGGSKAAEGTTKQQGQQKNTTSPKSIGSKSSSNAAIVGGAANAGKEPIMGKSK